MVNIANSHHRKETLNTRTHEKKKKNQCGIVPLLVRTVAASALSLISYHCEESTFFFFLIVEKSGCTQEVRTLTHLQVLCCIESDTVITTCQFLIFMCIRKRDVVNCSCCYSDCYLCRKLRYHFLYGYTLGSCSRFPSFSTYPTFVAKPGCYFSVLHGYSILYFVLILTLLSSIVEKLQTEKSQKP